MKGTFTQPDYRAPGKASYSACASAAVRIRLAL
jgi:hypothetical protein